MDSSLLLPCEPRSLQRFPNAQREERNHALRCVPSLSLKRSPTFHGLRWLARSAEARGPAPWTQASEHCPSDSLVFLAFRLAGRMVQRVRYSLSQ
jgi:hypothetical protein